MARIRTIKPGFFHSVTNAELPKPTRLTYIGLWTYVDDEGRGVDDARLIKAAIWPLDDDYPTRKVESDMVLLANAGKIRRYEVGARRYFRVVEWGHQRINRPQPSSLPSDPSLPKQCTDPAESVPPHGAVTADSLNDHGVLTEDSPPEGKGREGKGSGREGNPPQSPLPTTATAANGTRAEPKPATNGEKDRSKGKTPGHDRCEVLVERLLSVFPGQERRFDRVAAALVEGWLMYLDPVVIDEAIGTMLALDAPPQHPNYLNSVCRSRAAAHGVVLPDVIAGVET